MYTEILRKTQFFSGVDNDDISAMLNCLQAETVDYKSGDYVFREGDFINQITVLVKGKLLVQRDDFWGNRSIVNVINSGEMFGEAYVAPGSGAMLNDVIAVEDSTIIAFDINRILTVCPSACKFHTEIIKNLLFTIA